MNSFKESLLQLPLRAADFDWSKYMNNSKYLQIIEQGRWDWAEINGIDLVHSTLVGVVSNMNINYLVPIGWEPLKGVVVKTKLKEAKHYSIVLKQQIADTESSTIYADATVTLCLFDTIRKKPVKISKAMKIVR